MSGILQMKLGLFCSLLFFSHASVQSAQAANPASEPAIANTPNPINPTTLQATLTSLAATVAVNPIIPTTTTTSTDTIQQTPTVEAITSTIAILSSSVPETTLPTSAPIPTSVTPGTLSVRVAVLIIGNAPSTGIDAIKPTLDGYGIPFDILAVGSSLAGNVTLEDSNGGLYSLIVFADGYIGGLSADQYTQIETYEIKYGARRVGMFNNLLFL